MRVSVTLAAILLLLAACNKSEQKAPAANGQQAEAPAAGPQGPVKGVDRSRKGKVPRDIAFTDPDGGEISLADFKGTPVVVNLWATWCAPCVKELPTLDKAAASHRVDGQLAIIAVNQDSGPRASVQAFLDKLKIEDLGAYQDSKMALSGGLGAEVLPTTILFDAEGREVWRYVGDLDWTSPEAAKLLAEAGVPAKG